MGQLGLGILSWRGLDRLKKSLPTLAAGRLFDQVDEAVLFLPEAQPEAVLLGQSYGLDVRTAPDNLGILGGFQALAEMVKAETLLLLEDDCPLIEPPAEVARQVKLAKGALEVGDVQVFRLRHRYYPGIGRRFGVIDKLYRYHPPPSAPAKDQRAAALRRALRPGKAQRLAGNIFYEDGDSYRDPYGLLEEYGQTGEVLPVPQGRSHAPEAVFPELIEKCPGGYWRAKSATVPWSNQSIMVQRDFYLEKILAYAEAHPSPRRVNGFPDIEKELNGRYWRDANWWVGFDRGLFSHEIW